MTNIWTCLQVHQQPSELSRKPQTQRRIDRSWLWQTCGGAFSAGGSHLGPSFCLTTLDLEVVCLSPSFPSHLSRFRLPTCNTTIARLLSRRGENTTTLRRWLQLESLPLTSESIAFLFVSRVADLTLLYRYGHALVEIDEKAEAALRRKLDFRIGEPPRRRRRTFG